MDEGKDTIVDLKFNLDTQLGRISSKFFFERIKDCDVAAKRIKSGDL